MISKLSFSPNNSIILWPFCALKATSLLLKKIKLFLVLLLWKEYILCYYLHQYWSEIIKLLGEWRKKLSKRGIILILHINLFANRIFQEYFTDIYNMQPNILHLDIPNPGKNISEIHFLFLCHKMLTSLRVGTWKKNTRKTILRQNVLKNKDRKETWQNWRGVENIWIEKILTNRLINTLHILTLLLCRAFTESTACYSRRPVWELQFKSSQLKKSPAGRFLSEELN